MNKREYIGKVTKRIKVKRAVWNVAYVLLFRPFPTSFFWWWRRFVLTVFGAKVHPRANVYASVKIWAPWNLQMAEGSCMGPYVICYNQALIRIKKNAVVSQYAFLCTAGHQTDVFNNAANGLVTAPITICRDAWIGARAFIGMGVEIGEKAIVGATASVYKDVESGLIVGGNPARVIRKRATVDE